MSRSFVAFITLFLTTFIQAQPENLGVRVANLEQDIRILSQTVGSLRLELEAMSRENARLRSTVGEEIQKSANQYVTLSQLNSRLSSLVAELEASLATNQRATLAEVGKQIDDLAAQTQKALVAMSRSVAAAPELSTTTRFNNNFPKAGISYTVKTGDSLGKIARGNASRIEWIQNANKIAGELIYPASNSSSPNKTRFSWRNLNRDWAVGSTA